MKGTRQSGREGTGGFRGGDRGSFRGGQGGFDGRPVFCNGANIPQPDADVMKLENAMVKDDLLVCRTCCIVTRHQAPTTRTQDLETRPDPR